MPRNIPMMTRDKSSFEEMGNDEKLVSEKVEGCHGFILRGRDWEEEPKTS